ncbi:MAG TPA: cytochrome c peroxidase [Acetobacteraceae bacterium]|jgi:cytochrome c peroxidase
MNLARWLAICVVLLSGAATVVPAAEPRSRADAMKDFVRPEATPFPASNPYEARKAQLGQMLFFEPRLSGSKWISCATCHNPSLSWGDGLPRGIGQGMKTLGRRTPTILNLAWADLVMWDGRKTGLEDQVFGPMTSAAEMNSSIDEVVGRISAIGAYQREFKKVFGDEGVSARTIPLAIATYERTIVSGKAPFDRWIGGDESAISDDAKRGFDVFTGKGNCAACHTGWNLTDNSFHDIGLPDKDIGRGEWLKVQSMQHAFKTPTLRDVDRRGPYMHDGSLATLAEVIDHYDSGGTERSSLSNEMRPLHLTAAEKQALLAFLGTLTSDDPPVTLPVLPNPQLSSR